MYGEKTYAGTAKLSIKYLIHGAACKPVNTTVTSLFQIPSTLSIDYVVPGTIYSFDILSCNTKNFYFKFKVQFNNPVYQSSLGIQSTVQSSE